MNWRTLLRNVCSNWASYLVTAAAGFLLTPFIVHSLGNTGYGLWTLVLSVTGYFGLLDLGIRSSVGRFVARGLALCDEKSVNRTATTAFLMLAAAGTLALLASAVVAAFFFGALHVEPRFESAGRVAFLITGLNMSCVLPFSVFSAVLIGMERFDVVSGITIIGELTRAALVVAFLKSGYGLVALALIALSITVAEYFAFAAAAHVLYRPLKIRPRFADFAQFKELFGFGIHRFIWVVSNQLIFYSDSVVIGIFLGAGAITRYAIAGSLINYGRNVVSLVTDTMYPAATRMDAQQDAAGLQKLLIVGTRIALAAALPLCVGFLFLGKQFIGLWMGKEYLSSAAVLVVLTIPQFSAMSQYVSALILAGMAKHKALAWFALGEGLSNLALSIYLMRRIGIIGVAWGTVIPDVICTALVIPLYTLSVLKLDPREYLTKACLPPAAAAVPMAAVAYAFSALAPAPSWLGFAAEVAALLAVFAVSAYFVCLDPEQRAAVLLLRPAGTSYEA